MHTVDTMTATASCCGYTGTLAAIAVHSCYVEEQGGRCEDYPCCGHTDGDGCQTLPSHTMEFYQRNPHLMYEPGSPEWYDEMDSQYPYDDEPPAGMDFCKGCGETREFEFFDNHMRGLRGEQCLWCRIQDFVTDSMFANNTHPKRRVRNFLASLERRYR